MKQKQRISKGFTIIELLIATTVFSVVLLVFLVAFLRISQIFYKGVNMSRTQEAGRTIVQDISDDLQFDGSSPIIGAVNGNVGYFCVGNHRYTYYLGQQVAPSTPGVLRENLTGCPAPTGPGSTPPASNAEELLDSGMQVNSLSLGCPSGHCTVSMHLVFYGSDPTVLIPNAQAANAQCTGEPTSSQYCATVDVKSTVLQSF